MAKVLYISYWGALEPLGQSLVLPAVVKLSQMGAQITLITFEKPNDFAKDTEVARVKNMLKEAEIHWLPLKYHKTPKNPATAFDIAQGLVKSVFCRLKENFDIVHARTYVGGLIGLLLSPIIGAKFIYHNEGFYPDEQVDGGVWAFGSRTHLLAKRLENMMYARADGIIVLSNRARKIIENLHTNSSRQIPVIVVPSCVDLEHFNFSKAHSIKENDELKLVYIGSVGDRYTLDDIGQFVSTVKQENEGTYLQIYSKANPELIKKMLTNGGLPESSWKLCSVSYLEMPEHLAKHDVGLFFLKQGISEHGCSPTKIGEYWAMGLPVVTTPNVSDTDEIIRYEKVGVILENQSKDAYMNAFKELRELLDDPTLSERCRRAAEKYYSLLPACERQISLYAKLVKDI